MEMCAATLKRCGEVHEIIYERVILWGHVNRRDLSLTTTLMLRWFFHKFSKDVSEYESPSFDSSSFAGKTKRPLTPLLHEEEQVVQELLPLGVVIDLVQLQTNNGHGNQKT